LNSRKSFEEFYKSFGFIEYPFSKYTSENEVDKVKELFIEPLDYSPIKENFGNDTTMIIIGDRGTGKTAVLYDLLRRINDEKNIVCIIEDFSRLNDIPKNIEFYELLIRRLAYEVFTKLIDRTEKIKLLNKEEKLLLSYILSTFVDNLTQRNLKEKIQKIQISKAKRVGLKIYNYLRLTLNYGATAATNFANDVLKSHFSYLPPLEESKVKEIFPELCQELDTDFKADEVSYNLLNRFIDVIYKMEYEKVTFMIDKIDEDSRCDSDAGWISDFIKPLLTDNKLLLNEKMQTVVFMWAIPFNFLRSTIRTQKHYCPNLKWRNDDLVNALNRRISVFTNRTIKSYKELFAEDITDEDYNIIFKLANSNPRDLWHIFNRLFEVQYEIDSSRSKITKEVIKPGIIRFVQKFNFYEYYPKKKNAKANSMHIYAYIGHLLKLSDKEFTKNQLSDSAGTGGRTSSYTDSMESIGLIARTDKKINNGVVYEIMDPKVVFAIENSLEISGYKTTAS
jgi:hypothetical protein